MAGLTGAVGSNERDLDRRGHDSGQSGALNRPRPKRPPMPTDYAAVKGLRAERDNEPRACSDRATGSGGRARYGGAFCYRVLPPGISEVSSDRGIRPRKPEVRALVFRMPRPT